MRGDGRGGGRGVANVRRVAALALPVEQHDVLQEEEILAAQWFERGQVERAAAVEGATMQPEVAKRDDRK